MIQNISKQKCFIPPVDFLTERKANKKFKYLLPWLILLAGLVGGLEPFLLPLIDLAATDGALLLFLLPLTDLINYSIHYIYHCKKC